MSGIYGIVPSGFNPKPYDVILQDKKDRAVLMFGSNVDLSETSPLLKLLEVQALEEAELWSKNYKRLKKQIRKVSDFHKKLLRSK